MPHLGDQGCKQFVTGMGLCFCLITARLLVRFSLRSGFLDHCAKHEVTEIFIHLIFFLVLGIVTDVTVAFGPAFAFVLVGKLGLVLAWSSACFERTFHGFQGLSGLFFLIAC